MKQEPVRDEWYVVISLFMGLLAAVFALSASYFQDYHPGRGHLFFGGESARPASFPARVQLRSAETTSSPAAAAFQALTASSATPARAMPKRTFAGLPRPLDQTSARIPDTSVSRSRGMRAGLPRIDGAAGTADPAPSATTEPGTPPPGQTATSAGGSPTPGQPPSGTPVPPTSTPPAPTGTSAPPTFTPPPTQTPAPTATAVPPLPTLPLPTLPFPVP